MPTTMETKSRPSSTVKSVGLHSALILSGAAAALGFAPFNYWVLTVLGLALLFRLTISAPSVYSSAIRGLSFGFGYFCFGMSWIGVSINQYGNANAVTTAILVAFAALWLAPWLAATSALTRALINDKNNALQQAVVFALAVTAFEAMRYWSPLGLSWLGFGLIATENSLQHYLPLAGTSLTTLLVAAISALLVPFNAQRIQYLSAWFIIACIFGLSATLSDVEWTQPVPEQHLAVTVVQPNVAIDELWDRAQHNDILQRTIDMSTAFRDYELPVDLLIWPESAIPQAMSTQPDWRSFVRKRLEALAQLEDTELLAGTITKSPQGQYFNTVVHLQSDPELPLEFYHKRHLVAFGEYWPFAFALEPLARLLDFPFSNLSAGDNNQPVLTINKGSSSSTRKIGVGTLICYESAAPSVALPALDDFREFGIVFSNTGWFGDSHGPAQHNQTVKALAMMAQKTVIHVSTRGYTEQFSYQGLSQWQVPRNQAITKRSLVELRQGETPAVKIVRYINWIWLTVLLLLLTAVLVNRDPKK